MKKPTWRDHGAVLWRMVGLPVAVVIFALVLAVQILVTSVATFDGGCWLRTPGVNESVRYHWLIEHPDECYMQMPSWLTGEGVGVLLGGASSGLGVLVFLGGRAFLRAYKKRIRERIGYRKEE